MQNRTVFNIQQISEKKISFGYWGEISGAVRKNNIRESGVSNAWNGKR